MMIMVYLGFSVMGLLSINVIVLQKQINLLTHENTVVKEHLRQVEYASIYMGQVNGAFPINSEKITLVSHNHRVSVDPNSAFEELQNIQYFYNLKLLEMDWWLIGNSNLPNLIYPDAININVKKLILKNVDCHFYQRKVFENYPNLEELEININGGFGGSMFDTTKYCNPSTKLKKIVFNQNNKINIHFTGSNIDYTPIMEYYSTRGVEVVVNLVD